MGSKQSRLDVCDADLKSQEENRGNKEVSFVGTICTAKAIRNSNFCVRRMIIMKKFMLFALCLLFVESVESAEIVMKIGPCNANQYAPPSIATQV